MSGTIEPFGEVAQTAVSQDEEVDLGEEFLFFRGRAFGVPPEEFGSVGAVGGGEGFADEGHLRNCSQPFAMTFEVGEDKSISNRGAVALPSPLFRHSGDRQCYR